MDLEHGILLFLVNMIGGFCMCYILMRFEEHIEEDKKKPPSKKEWWH